MFDTEQYMEMLDKGNAIGARQYLSSCIPKYLYKFYSLADEYDKDGNPIPDNIASNKRKLDTLANNENWYDLAKNQNDPFDTNMAYISDSLAKEKEAIPEAIETAKLILNKLRDSMVLCSFIDSTESNLPMWANYSNNSRGYCIRYEISRPEVFYKVLYTPERMGMIGIPLRLVAAMQESARLGKETQELETMRELCFTIMCAKHESWQAEKEYRIICATDDGKGMRISNTNVGIRPETIFIGINCADKHRTTLSEIGNRKLNCNVLQCNVSETQFFEFTQV